MLKINNLTKHYKGSDKGVNNVTLHIDKGDIYAFIGHNGAMGKVQQIALKKLNAIRYYYLVAVYCK